MGHPYTHTVHTAGRGQEEPLGCSALRTGLRQRRNAEGEGRLVRGVYDRLFFLSRGG